MTVPGRNRMSDSGAAQILWRGRNNLVRFAASPTASPETTRRTGPSALCDRWPASGNRRSARPSTRPGWRRSQAMGMVLHELPPMQQNMVRSPNQAAGCCSDGGGCWMARMVGWPSIGKSLAAPLSDDAGLQRVEIARNDTPTTCPVYDIVNRVRLLVLAPIL